MNKQLIIVGIIVIIFFIIFWSSIKNSFKKEDFYSSEYPSDLIKSHKKYIDDSSNRYNKIYYEIEKLSSFKFDIDFAYEGGCIFIDYENNKYHPFKRLNEIDNNNIYPKLKEAIKIYINYLNKTTSQTTSTISKLLSLTYEDFKKDSIYIDNRNLLLGLLRLYLYFATENCKCSSEIITDKGNDDFDLLNSDNNDANFCNIIRSDKNMCNSFRNMKKKYEVYINNKFKPKFSSSFRVLIKSEQEFILKNFLESLLTDLVNTKINLSLGELPCVFYSKDKCPGYEYSDDKDDIEIKRGKKFNYGEKGEEITLASTADINNITRCDIVGEKGNEKCVDKVNRFETENCDIMTGYGKEQCERIRYKDNKGKPKNCEYDPLIKRCVNPKSPDDSDTYNCLNIRDKGDCGKNDNCNFNADIDRCLNTDKTLYNNQNNLACYSLSGVKGSNGPHENPSLFGCKGIDITNETGEPTYTFFKHKKANSVECSDVNDIMNILPNDTELRKSLCERNPKDWNAKDSKTKYCKYHEYTKHGVDDKDKGNGNDIISFCESIEDYNKKKYSYLARFKSKEDCDERLGYKWDKGNKGNKCVSLDLTKERCNTIIDNDICGYHDKCIWQKSPDDNAPKYRGYCRDLSRQLNELEETIEHIHENHIRKEIKLENIQKDLLNNMDSIRNNIAKRIK